MFNFKLQKVLDYREGLEKKSKEHFGICLKVLQEEKDSLYILKSKKLEVQNKRSSLNLATANDFQLYQRYIEFLENSICLQIEKINDAENKLMEARQKLLESTKDKRIIEILKESKYQDFLDEENKLEQKSLDDMALRTYLARGEI